MAWERNFEAKVMKVREKELKYQKLNYTIEVCLPPNHQNLPDPAGGPPSRHYGMLSGNINDWVSSTQNLDSLV
jgi:hypothetical protein